MTLFHGLQGFLNYTYFQEGYKVHWCTHYVDLPKTTHQYGFLKGHIVGNGWLFLIEEEGPLLFARRVGSLATEGW